MSAMCTLNSSLFLSLKIIVWHLFMKLQINAFPYTHSFNCWAVPLIVIEHRITYLELKAFALCDIKIYHIWNEWLASLTRWILNKFKSSPTMMTNELQTTLVRFLYNANLCAPFSSHLLLINSHYYCDLLVYPFNGYWF